MRKTFMDRALDGEIQNLEEELKNELVVWQAEDDGEEVGMTIHLWLGMTWQEYADYISLSLSLEEIVKGRLN